MSAHDVAVPLKHMRDAALRAIEIARPLTREHLSADHVETLGADASTDTTASTWTSCGGS
jgi:hypothetical protein